MLKSICRRINDTVGHRERRKGSQPVWLSIIDRLMSFVRLSGLLLIVSWCFLATWTCTRCYGTFLCSTLNQSRTYNTTCPMQHSITAWSQHSQAAHFSPAQEITAALSNETLELRTAALLSICRHSRARRFIRLLQSTYFSLSTLNEPV